MKDGLESLATTDAELNAVLMQQQAGKVNDPQPFAVGNMAQNRNHSMNVRQNIGASSLTQTMLRPQSQKSKGQLALANQAVSDQVRQSKHMGSNQVSQISNVAGNQQKLLSSKHQ